MSRQRTYQIKHMASGLCMLCPEKVEAGNRWYCAKHRAAHNARMRKYYQIKRGRMETRQRLAREIHKRMMQDERERNGEYD